MSEHRTARYVFECDLWQYPGKGGWHFVAIPAEVSDAIKAIHKGAHKPFGSLAVMVTVGSFQWRTSVFADTKSATYLLPVKGEIRKRANLQAGQRIRLALEI